MTALSDQCDVIRGWLAIGPDVYPDSVVTSWIRMAEEAISKRLRVKEMIQIDVGTLVQDPYLLPDDWREMDFVRVIGGKPRRYVPRDDYYNTDQEFADDQKNCYTLVGKYIIVGGVVSTAPIQLEISYYQDIPPLGTDPNWILTKSPTLYTVATLGIASMYAIEDERGPLWQGQTDTLIDDLNVDHARSKASGSRLTLRHRRSFG
jgi:hypothetical protein